LDQKCRFKIQQRELIVEGKKLFDSLYEIDEEISRQAGAPEISPSPKEKEEETEEELVNTQEERQKQKKTHSKVQFLVKKQFADGHWKLEEEMAGLLDVSWESLQKNPPSVVGNHDSAESQR
jgi:hypothetical protein